MTFRITILFLINILKSSIQSELDGFFGDIEKSDTKVHKVTNSGFSQARAKLKYTAFVELDSLQIDYFYENTDFKTWNGYRLIAVDGSTLVVPSTEETQEFFGVSETKKNGQKIVLARISEAFDPLNHITVDAAINPYNVSEHTMMIQHMKKFSKGDLAIYDRNYPGFWIYKLHQANEIEFCMRVSKKGRGKFIDDFVASQQKDKIVDVSCRTRESKKKCKELGIDSEDMKCRLLRIELKSGEIEVLITSLLDTETFSYECFDALYHLRWPVEEDYKFLKYRIEIGNFSGKSKEAIYQDFYAKIFTANLTSVLAFDSNIELEKKTETRKHKYKINWTNAADNMKGTGFLLFVRDNYDGILSKLHKLFQVSPVSVRPERSFVRYLSRHKKSFSMCYK